MYGYPAPYVQPFSPNVLPTLPDNFAGLGSDGGIAGGSGLLSPADLVPLLSAGALMRAEANMAVPPAALLPAEGLDIPVEEQAVAPAPRMPNYRLGGADRIELQKRVQQAAWATFRPDWYRQHPEAVEGLDLPADFDAWKTARWPDAAAWLALSPNPIEYDFRFGSYQYPLAFQNNAPAGDIVSFAAGARRLADRAEPSAPGTELLPLGVFALVPRGQSAATLLTALALDKAGAVRGSYLDLATGTTGTLSGSLDKESQLVAWHAGTGQATVMQTGLSSLTKDQATMLAHADNGWTRILHSIRLQPQPATERTSRRDAARRSR